MVAVSATPPSSPGAASPSAASLSAASPGAASSTAASSTAAPREPAPATRMLPAAAPGRPVGRAGFTLTADGTYGACLATDADGNWFPERWTLHGPEAYTVPLPCAQPEEPGTTVLPLADGRVLIRRLVGCTEQTFSLLHPSGPDTTEQSLGSVTAPRLALVPPAPESPEVYALAPPGPGGETTAVWRVYGGGFAGAGTARPERVGELPGRCAARGWLDRTGRVLAVDQELAGRTKAVTVVLHDGVEVSPLLQLTAESNDRLLLADPDSGLLLLCSDAPGHDRLGWGVVGSGRPVRFPEALCPPETAVTPFAVQPGQVLTPEQCGVALRLDGPGGCRLGVWRPVARRLVQLPPLPGWITGSGLWTQGGELRLPYATPAQPCGLARLAVPDPAAEPAEATAAEERTGAYPATDPAPDDAGGAREEDTHTRPVPLRHAPL
ncbi:hypothetical protein O7599_29620 [Streptomyces sp. WMMC500]|uniref:hypothetical protein n=1 Tax=Streptomyces sp. WMMC500 TaxID=3015154 RepID=UPI00248BA5C3|nr:hypothetical protein [Streptomyces sp. WMMC500]WBB64685.1 hypothetical protein O7599_29620 [Streptomyces sp. WMMC500]